MLDRFKRRQKAVSLSLVELCGDGFRVVVGESHYQEALRATSAVCVEQFEGRPSFTAALVSERDNPYDANAISVWGPRGRLGYFPRDDALEYRELFAEITRRGYDGGGCGAHLTGGEAGESYGVVLRLADPETCLDELDE